MATLSEALQPLADALGVSDKLLWSYAREDTVGGYHPVRTLSKWPMGSLFGVEGQVLYAVTRVLKPEFALEIGTWRGCSASHILMALEANDYGRLVSVDVKMHDEGIDIPAKTRKRWKFYESEGATWMAQVRPTAEIVFEDAAHDFDTTCALLMAIKEFVRPKILLGHDARHRIVGPDIRRAWDTVFGKDNYNTVLIEPSDCGLAWKVF